MNKFMYQILNMILNAQKKHLDQDLKKRNQNVVFMNSTTKISMNGACTLKLNMKTEQNKQKAELQAKEIIKKYIKTPDKILEFAEANGARVYKNIFADKLLNIINETQGFLVPMKGIKAFLLNLYIGIFMEQKLKISFETEPMFIFDETPDIYMIARHFYRWYGYKMKLPGYDFKTQSKFRETYKNRRNCEYAFSKCTVNEMLSMKEAIHRDIETIDFVINLAKEHDAAKKSFEKLVAQGASI